jgi:histidinol phosphatase-like PHP family hydrolase
MVPLDLQRLDDDLLRWFEVCTHVHTNGSSGCSGQQTPAQVVEYARALGHTAVILCEHTGDPRSPRQLKAGDAEFTLIRQQQKLTEATAVASGFDIRPGLECNTALWLDHRKFNLDVPFRYVVPPLEPAYVVGSLHGDSAPYQIPRTLMRAIQMLCGHSCVDTLGHITRGMAHVDIDWGDVGHWAAETGTMIELNLNQWFVEMGQNQPRPADSSVARFWREFLTAVARTPAMVIIGSDIHNEGMWPTPTAAAGWETTIKRIGVFFELLESCGFTPERMVGANVARVDRVLGTLKRDRPGMALGL